MAGTISVTGRRTGEYRTQPGGTRAFVPSPLPPDPPIKMDRSLIRLLSDADRAVAALDSATLMLPDPDRFVYSYVRAEAVLSSQIEGTQSSLDDLVRAEAGIADTLRPRDVTEVSNYVAAINDALAALPTLPVSGRLIRDAHRRLMRGVRGGNRTPGEFRKHQVLIGAEGAAIDEAIFVPPPPEAVPGAIAALEHYLHDAAEDGDPPLVRIGLAHAQFETIHPFGDGNGRCGRLLISLLLSEMKLLSRPVLYLSAYLRRHRTEYYERLQAIRDNGDFEGWITFFLRGVTEVAIDARDRAQAIVALREEHRGVIATKLTGHAGKAFQLLDDLYQRPYVNISAVTKTLHVSFPTATRIVNALEQHGVLVEVTGRRRNRVFVYQSYVTLFANR